KVTAADIQKAVKTYFDPGKRVVVWSDRSAPKGVFLGGEREKREARAPMGSGFRTRNSVLAARQSPLAQHGGAGAGGGDFPIRKATRKELANGLTVLLLESHRLPIVAAQVTVRNVSLLEPENQIGVATLTGYLLDEGTSKMKGPQIAEAIGNVGGSMSLS